MASTNQGSQKTLPIMQAVSVAFLTYRRYLQRNALRHGITLKQSFVLRHLADRGYLCPSEIADMLYSDRPTASVIIKNMEKQGWVKRTLDPDNAKRTRVSLEPAGREKLETVRREQAELEQAPFDPLACFTRAEQKQLRQLLAKLNDHLEQLKDRSLYQI